MSIYIPEGWALIEKEGRLWVFGSWLEGTQGLITGVSTAVSLPSKRLKTK